MKSSCTKEVSITLAQATLILAFLTTEFILFCSLLQNVSLYALFVYYLDGLIQVKLTNTIVNINNSL